MRLLKNERWLGIERNSTGASQDRTARPLLPPVASRKVSPAQTLHIDKKVPSSSVMVPQLRCVDDQRLRRSTLIKRPDSSTSRRPGPLRKLDR